MVTSTPETLTEASTVSTVTTSDTTKEDVASSRSSQPSTLKNAKAKRKRRKKKSAFTVIWSQEINRNLVSLVLFILIQARVFAPSGYDYLKDSINFKDGCVLETLHGITDTDECVCPFRF
ncbi:unnamed protein product [Clavelina lepadiformis]|uniref:Uncharacterized protein n=1 Tax=Clavelina lepadiformis TaxID=159417 RepID=A0ABP0GHK8_CLALP